MNINPSISACRCAGGSSFSADTSAIKRVQETTPAGNLVGSIFMEKSETPRLFVWSVTGRLAHQKSESYPIFGAGKRCRSLQICFRVRD
jgi:hypothetical protein